MDLDYLALSFVRSAADIELLRQYLRNRTSDINIVAWPGPRARPAPARAPAATCGRAAGS
jgi:hypothetical protein